MARPFPTTFEKDSQMSPQSGGSTPISYQANVNRQKTKKWTDAKPVDYGGDDWGDDDEYHYEEPPPPAPKPTGLRQQGHTLSSASPANSPIADNGKKNYGDLPPLPTSEIPRPRNNSFDAGDEKRNFSSSAIPTPSQTAAAGPATRFSQITGQPSTRNASGPPSLSISTQPDGQYPTGMRHPSQAVQPASEQPYKDVASSGRADSLGNSSLISPISDTRTPSSDYQARRDYSPTAVPAPLSTRSPVAQPTSDTPASRFPARKSSLSQAAPPSIAEITDPPQESTQQKPWIGGRDASPGPRIELPSAAAAKPLPFIRPADIYRRAEEERRQSLESGGRPSMDALIGSRPGERSESPGKPPLREQTSSDSLGGRRRASAEGDDSYGTNRHLMPMLEPVKERKSEYGFEGFDVKDHGPEDDLASPTVPGQTVSDPAQLDVQEARRNSTSPKLPDLNRISGFGMDMFFNPDASKPPPAQLPAVDEVPAPQTSSADVDKSQLPRQPSTGLRSVVNQAFERVDDSSVPPTPTSGESGVRRADSDSTGGISPIMRYGPGASQPESSLNEIVEEHVGPTSTSVPPQEGSTDNPVNTIPGFKQGHRRDLSAPRSDNSPARTPDVAKAEYFPPGQQAAVMDPTADLNEEPVATRPVAHTDDSFRPTLPGGWTSYSASTRTETPQPEGTRTPSSLARDQSDEDHNDITPTTKTRALPQSALGAAAVAAFGSGAALGRHDEDSPLGPPAQSISKPNHNNESLPTPDPTMAPGGNLYSAASVDPRLLPKLEQSPPENELQPGMTKRSISGDSSDIPPPPLPKDTPVLDSTAENEGFFPASGVPRKRSIDSWEEDGEPDSPVKQYDTQAGLHDIKSEEDDNDKLEEEIVQRLSPQPSEGKTMDHSLLHTQPNDTTRESTYLPTEYGDYWASTAEAAAEPTPSDKQGDREIASDTAEHPVNEKRRLSHAESEDTSIAPLAVQRSEQPLEEAERPPLKQRFSWEQSTESVPDLAVQEKAFSDEKQLHEAPAPIAADNGPTATPVTDHMHTELHDEKIPLSQENPSSPRGSSDENHTGRNAAIVGGAAALAAGGIAAATLGNQTSQPERRLSLADEKATRVSSYPVNATPPEDEHPARSPQSYFQSTTDYPTPSAISPINSPVATHPPQITGRLLAFKEIAAIKSPYQRIQTFDETRYRFAAMDSGLKDWIATLQAQHPEHANVTGSWANSGPSGAAASRSKAGKPGSSQPLQQPYYQQYLNASSPTNPSTPVAKPGPSTPAAYQQQGFSPAGPSKITTQQVQAKGKEFLHTAGVFGGKAGKAGKGLLAKGKSKFRGSGGDKTSPVPPQPKNDRRSSWSLPLSLSKSAGRSDSNMSTSREAAPGPMPTNGNQRFTAATSVQSFPSQSPPALSAEPPRSLGNTPSPNIQIPHVPSPSPSPPTLPPIQAQSGSNDDFTTSVREIRDADQSTTESESHDKNKNRDSVDDDLRVPAPIGKHQPSWDPFNATPIAEEQGSAYDNQPTAKSYPFPSAAADHQGKLFVPTDAADKSDRSNSVDVHFHDAVEEQMDIRNDWVMVDSQPKEAGVTVPSEADTARAADTQPPSMMHRPRGSSYGVPILPTGSAATDSTGKSAVVPANVSAPSGPDAFVAGPEYQPEDPNQPDAARNEPQNTGDSSFLPPIRRTSTFGFKLGSRHAKQRFPIDDDDEVASPPVPIESLSTLRAADETAPATAASDVNRIVTRRDSQPEGPSSLRQQFAGDVKRESTETVRQEPNLQVISMKNIVDKGQARIEKMNSAHTVTQDPPRRPSLVQASSSEYSQVSSESTTERLYQVPGFQAERPGMSQAQTSRSRQSSVERSMHTQQLPHEQKPSSVSPPSLEQESYFGDSQNKNILQRGSEANAKSTRVSNLPQSEDFRTSQQSWLPNAVAPSHPSPPSPLKHNAPITYMPRQSWEAQRPRASSGSGQGFMQRPSDPYIDRTQWIPQQSRGFEQPPSSAQRYPDLFKTDQSAMDAYDKETGAGGDLPPQYYQPPLPREAVFLPRQQTNEYQLPGVGPPDDEPPGRSPRRNSSFFKEVGGRISRAASRERGMSFSRNDDAGSLRLRSESRGNDYADSTLNGEEIAEQKKRRSSFFRVGSRGSSNALNTPDSRESMVAHHAGSRTDLMMASQPLPLATQEKKRSFFGGSSSTNASPKPKKLTRASTSGLVEPSAGKKKRFSGLSGFFGKSSPAESPASDRPQATRELSYNERQPLDSPYYESRNSSRQQTPLRQSDIYSPETRDSPAPQARYSTPALTQSNFLPPQAESSRPSSQGRRAALAKLTTSMEPPSPVPQEVKPRKVSKARPSSGAGLLGGIMSRRRSSQQEEKSDDSRSQGSNQPQTPQLVPLAQTYTDLQNQEPQQAPVPRRENFEPTPYTVPQERGRQTGREPQYDSVPIPGGYSLVRGQGAQVVNSDYDPRGIRSQQVDPRFVQRNDPSPGAEWGRLHQQERTPQQSFPQQQRYQQQPYQQQNQWGGQPLQHTGLQTENQKAKHTPPNLAALDTYQMYQARQGGQLSVEDQIARSPARSPQGQQRPYQLSLPEDNDDREYPVRGNHSSLSPSSPTARSPLSITTSQPQPRPQHEAIQRLSRNTPQLRHPESPAGYPLPDDVVFSPINPSADDMPPPPPPKDTPHPGFTQVLSQNSYLNSTDLNRSSTHRTAVSALSRVSDSNQYHNQGSDSSNHNNFLSENSGRNVSSIHRSPSDGDRHVSSPSPTPPSPAGTPDPSNQHGIRTTLVEADRRPSLDIYDASPMNAPRPNNSTNGPAPQHETDRRFAELEGTKADGFQMKIGRNRAQEEKIFYDAESGLRGGPSGRGDDFGQGNVAMSATSYPGQEWNPYAYDDDDGR